MSAVRGLKEFCKKHRVPIPSGDDFNLLDFIISVSKHQPLLSEYRGAMNEISGRLGPDSEDWGGCPRCGSNVHTGLSDCPVCGLDLTSDEEIEDDEASEDALAELDPEYIEEDSGEEDSALDGLVEDEEEDDDDDADEEEPEDTDATEFEEEDEYEYVDEENESDDVDDQVDDDGSDYEEELDDEEESEEESPEEEEYEEEYEEEDPEPLSVAKQTHNRKVFKRQQEKKKASSRRNTATHAEKVKKRNETRTKIQKAIPQFRKRPGLIEKLKYQHLLILPGLLGYDRKPTTLGSKADIQAWVKRKLQEGRRG